MRKIGSDEDEGEWVTAHVEYRESSLNLVTTGIMPRQQTRLHEDNHAFGLYLSYPGRHPKQHLQDFLSILGFLPLPFPLLPPHFPRTCQSPIHYHPTHSSTESLQSTGFHQSAQNQKPRQPTEMGWASPRPHLFRYQHQRSREQT